MLREKTEFNLNIFNLDPEVRNSEIFTNFLFTSDEISRLRDYIEEFNGRYPIVRNIAALLLATHLFKFDIISSTLDSTKVLEDYHQFVQNKMDEANSLKDSESQNLMQSAIIYCLESAQQTIDFSENNEVQKRWNSYFK